MAPTLRQIAQKTGFSVPTVSQILNNRPGNYCSEANRRLILKTAEKLGYRQEYADKIRRGVPTRTLAIVRTRHMTIENQTLVMRLLDKFQGNGCPAYVVNTEPGDDVFRMIRDLLARGVDRFLLMDPLWPDVSQEKYRQLADLIRQAGRTYVGSPCLEERHVVQDFGPAVTATLEFFEQRIGKNYRMLLTSHLPTVRQKALLAHFPELSREEVLTRYTFLLDFPDNVRDIDRMVQEGYRSTEKLMRQFPGTRGLYYNNDQLALGGVHWLVKHGLVPGRDVLVAGFNDYPGTRYCGYPVSTAAHDIEALSDAFVREIGRSEPCDVLIPPKIILREKAVDPADDMLTYYNTQEGGLMKDER